MIDDKDLEYNMALYLAMMEDKYQLAKSKRVELETIINNAAIKIQRKYRKCIIKRKTRAAIVVQRWWRVQMERVKERRKWIEKFRKFYYGLIITKFMIRKWKAKSIKIKSQKIQSKYLSKTQTDVKKQLHISILSRITRMFPSTICRKQALLTQHKYISKYRQYLKQKFNADWQAYEKRITVQLWKQINKKWVRIDSNKNKIKSINNSNNNNNREKGNTHQIYLNEQDKQVNADEFVCSKLNKMYGQAYGKHEQTQARLQQDQQQIMFAVRMLQARYRQWVMKNY